MERLPKVRSTATTFVENLSFEGMPLQIVYKGKISGDEIKLTRVVAEAFTEEAVAKRAK